MPETLKGWPNRSEKIKRPDGKTEIILPEPVDMNKFSREELAVQARNNRSVEMAKMKPISPQFSAKKGMGSNKLVCESKEERLIAAKKIHRRQEEIKMSRSQERNFRENQKENGAENYDKIWDR